MQPPVRELPAVDDVVPAGQLALPVLPVVLPLPAVAALAERPDAYTMPLLK